MITPQWEYYTTEVDSDGVTKDHRQSLNELGREGWELVSVGLSYANYGMYGTAFLKRQLNRPASITAWSLAQEWKEWQKRIESRECQIISQTGVLVEKCLVDDVHDELTFSGFGHGDEDEIFLTRKDNYVFTINWLTPITAD